VILGRAEKLSIYDVTYLELAMRRGLALAAKDQALLDAAKRVGVVTLS
jgi:predicted nucleic acid-binding protein